MYKFKGNSFYIFRNINIGITTTQLCKHHNLFSKIRSSMIMSFVTACIVLVGIHKNFYMLHKKNKDVMKITFFFFFQHNFCVKPYVPREPRKDPSNRGSMSMGYISDTARNRTHNLFRPKQESIPLSHSDSYVEWRPLYEMGAKILGEIGKMLGQGPGGYWIWSRYMNKYCSLVLNRGQWVITTICV